MTSSGTTRKFCEWGARMLRSPSSRRPLVRRFSMSPKEPPPQDRGPNPDDVLRRMLNTPPDPRKRPKPQKPEKQKPVK